MLTPEVATESMALSSRFLQRKMSEYEAMKADMEDLHFEADESTPVNEKKGRVLTLCKPVILCVGQEPVYCL